MTVFQAALLGLVQGFSEFLPISSSGHLVLVQNYFNITQGAVVFDIFLHFATLFAVLIYFWKDLLKITKNEVINLIIASIPAALVGVFLEDTVTQLFSSVTVVGVFLLITGMLNFVTEYKLNQQKQVSKKLGLKEAIFIGLFQAVAVLPGISRSGSTVSAGAMQNLERKEIFRFSFLMVVPVILGANLIHLIRLFGGESLAIEPLSLLVGGGLAFLSGLLSLKIFEYIIVKAKMNYFGVYCVTLGLLVIISSLS